MFLDTARTMTKARGGVLVRLLGLVASLWNSALSQQDCEAAMPFGTAKAIPPCCEERDVRSVEGAPC